MFYLSQLAQIFQLQIIIPPTVLIGFKEHNRLMFNDEKTGTIVVKAEYLAPDDVSKFIIEHMNSFASKLHAVSAEE